MSVWPHTAGHGKRMVASLHVCDVRTALLFEVFSLKDTSTTNFSMHSAKYAAQKQANGSLMI